MARDALSLQMYLSIISTAVEAYAGYQVPRWRPTPWQGRLAADDQREFDKEYANWLEVRAATIATKLTRTRAASPGHHGAETTFLPDALQPDSVTRCRSLPLESI